MTVIFGYDSEDVDFIAQKNREIKREDQRTTLFRKQENRCFSHVKIGKIT